MSILGRRAILMASAGGWLLGFAGLGTLSSPACADDKIVQIGISLPLTGADAAGATRIKDAAIMAIEEVNSKGGIPGYTIEAVVLDSGTATAGQYDPAQAALNARKFVADRKIVALVGPENSGEGKAMAPILSAADLATITPTSTNPDITNPKFAEEFRPGGKAIYFRTVTTDAFEGPYLANFMKKQLHAKSVFIVDDSGTGGVGNANAFEAQARKNGIKVLGHESLDPRASDYNTVLIKMKSLSTDALYYAGGGSAVATKLIKEAYDVIPRVVKVANDGVYSPEPLQGAGFPAAEGWYVGVPSPHLIDNPDIQAWARQYQHRFGIAPDDFAITAYDGTRVILDAIERVAKSGQEVTRVNVRDAIQRTHLKTLQGEIAFDENGDLIERVISVFQIRHDPKYPANDILHQFKYVGLAPTSAD